ncbi:ATP-binding protein [Micromonospora sp. NPDC047670]|uniref:ATP-binding protein n=1 Tax=Micromonospora sp. NPDC047670 TaxID=3364252 RepID=UPI00370FE715
MSDDAANSEPVDPASVPAPATELISQDFTAATVTALRHRLQAAVTAAGLTGDVGYDFVLAVHELVTNAVRHGGGHGRLDLRCQDDLLICEITDQGPATGSLPVRLPAADVVGGRGLWLAHRLAEGLVLTRRLHGVTATVATCLTRQDSPDVSSAPGALRPDRPSGRPEDDDR